MLSTIILYQSSSICLLINIQTLDRHPSSLNHPISYHQQQWQHLQQTKFYLHTHTTKMESLSSYLHINLHHRTLIFSHPPSTNPSIISFPYYRFFKLNPQRFVGFKVNNNNSKKDESGYGGADLLRKPVVELKDEVEVKVNDGGERRDDEEYDDDDGGKRREEDGWIDWEDQILEDTVPLVGFVRMILHSTKYASGERLSPEHERTILERLLPHHPESEKKIGCGINYITVGYHPDFESSRCLFIVRKDGTMVDFSYWKCIKGLIRKNYPLYADSFILRHFRRRRHND